MSNNDGNWALSSLHQLKLSFHKMLFEIICQRKKPNVQPPLKCHFLQAVKIIKNDK